MVSGMVRVGCSLSSRRIGAHRGILELGQAGVGQGRVRSWGGFGSDLCGFGGRVLVRGLLDISV